MVTMTIGIVRFVLQCLFFFTAPSKRMRFCLKTEIFFHIDLPSTRTRWKWSPKTHLFKNFLHSEDFFENAGPLVYVSMDENEGFPIRWCNTSFTTSITHALWGMLSYFQCLAFSYGQAKTIRIRHVWTRIFLENGGKRSRFQKYPDTCGRSLRLWFLLKKGLISFTQLLQKDLKWTFLGAVTPRWRANYIKLLKTQLTFLAMKEIHFK